MDAFIGEIRMFSFQITPKYWLPCYGQILPIERYRNLFHVIGTTYGGDGLTTFALPDFRSRIPIHSSSTFELGTSGGEAESTLYIANMPPHNHPITAAPIKASSSRGTSGNPSGAFPANSGSDFSYSAISGVNDFAAADAIHARAGAYGSNIPFSNMMPSVSINFCICFSR